MLRRWGEFTRGHVDDPHRIFTGEELSFIILLQVSVRAAKAGEDESDFSCDKVAAIELSGDVASDFFIA